MKILNKVLSFLLTNKYGFYKLLKRKKIFHNLYVTIRTEINKREILHSPPFSKKWYNKYIIVSWDPIKLASMALAINRIDKLNIEGAFSEFGVYLGETSEIIHNLAPERKLYLFDTFEGFPEEFLEQKEYVGRFKPPDLFSIKAKFGASRNIIIRKGIFPDTTKGLEELRFAFVNIDADLYKSTLEGLKFFYPRVVKGGYIFIHDYNNPAESNAGVYRAVNEFMMDKPEKIVEIPDALGTVILRKL